MWLPVLALVEWIHAMSWLCSSVLSSDSSGSGLRSQATSSQLGEEKDIDIESPWFTVQLLGTQRLPK